MQLCDKDMCTGCGACYNMCPIDAVDMKPDHQGFLYPDIDNFQCNNCGMCRRICPVLHPDHGNFVDPICYAAMAEDGIRIKSSSGGLFYLFASAILRNGGVVCGAAFKNPYTVEHICITEQDDLPKLQKSKYVQSNVGNIYRDIKIYLESGQKVLFSGCPCQVAGLNAYLIKTFENLYTVDLLCHGVPSQMMLRDYLDEKFGLENVKSIDFRDKSMGWGDSPRRLAIFLRNGDKCAVNLDEFQYGEAFLINLSLRQSCYSCDFCNFPRQGDLSIGDFWSIQRFDVNLFDDKGTSLIFVNNDKGAELLRKEQSRLKALTVVPRHYTAGNRISAEWKIHKARNRFLSLYPSLMFTKAVNYSLKEHYDIGIAGGWCHFNYGDEIAHYALYRVVESMGYSALMLQWPSDSSWEPLCYPPMFRENPYPDYAVSESFSKKSDLRMLNGQCDIFITGPGQYHNPVISHAISDMPLLNFVNNNRLKIAYCASWGHDPMMATEHDKANFSYYLQQFDAFSVRETCAKEYASQELSVEAEWVLDPVFICDPKILHNLADKAVNNLPESPFIFSYMLDNSSQNDKILRYYEEKFKLPLKVAAHDSYRKELNLPWSIEPLTDFMIEDWLAYFRHSEWIVTDSFHGMCMAILFQKPFIVIVRKAGGVSRYYSLLNPLGLNHRIVDGEHVHYDDKRLFEPIDYVPVSDILNRELRRSLKWLETVLAKKPVTKAYSLHTILDQRIEGLERNINNRIDNINEKYNQMYEDMRNLNRDEIDRIIQSGINEMNEYNIQLEQKINNLYNSCSYRLGRLLTWLPRKIRGGNRCIIEHGIKYTFVYFCKKVRNKLSP